MQENTLTVSGVFSQAWTWWKEEYQYVYYLLLPVAVVSVISAVLISTGGFLFGLVGFLGQILYIFFSMCVTASLLFFVNSNQKEVWEDWKKYVKLFPKFFLVNLLFGIMVLVGLIFLIVPGVYLAIRYAFVGYIFLEKPETKIEQLFTASARLTEGNRVALFLVMFVSLVLAAVGMGIAGAIFGGAEPLFSIATELVSYLAVTPLIGLVSIAAYDTLKKRGTISPEPEEAPAEEKTVEPEVIAIAPEPAV
jgi:uncharacterized membrane protein